MKHGLRAAFAASLIAGALCQKPSPVLAGAGFVDIDAVVVDAEGHPVRGLRAGDFELREDNRVAPILTAEDVSTDVAPHVDEDRVMALVLDDLAMLPAYTSSMQDLARAFLARGSTRDRIAVLRLGHHEGELFFGHLGDALLRIRSYTAEGRVSFDVDREDWLDTVASISRQFGEADGRRKTIVAVGAPALLNPLEPEDRSRHGSWPHWINAVGSAARTNTAIYVINPTGIAGRLQPLGDGLAEQTGGQQFSTLNLNRVFEQIWSDIAHYYVLSYVPMSPRRVHSIAVSVRKPGVRVRARHVRGE